MNQLKRYYIPKHAHGKAIEHYKRQQESATYPVREINGCHGGVIRTLERRRRVSGLRVYFMAERAGGKLWTSILRFERTF